MAILHTPRPGKSGELDFLNRIQHLLPDDTHVWAELNSHTLGSGDECDLLLAAPNLGAFAVEVKAIILDQIEEMGPKTCKIRYSNGIQTKHPLEQARSGMHSLRNYLEKNAQRTPARYPYPFMKEAVAFPKFRFDEFADAFGASSQLLALAENRFLFADDLESADAICRQLQRIYAGRPCPTEMQIEFLIEHLSIDEAVSRKPSPSAADAERARLAIRRIANAPSAGSDGAPKQSPASRSYLDNSETRVVIFEGAPGTGKTMELIRVALEHAAKGRRVLFTCFNLVLASFLEGLLAHEDVSDELTSHIDIIPVGRLSALAKDYEESMADLYDTVCVDESQDLTDGAFDDIRLVAKGNSRWFLADGPGQEIYNGGVPARLLVHARAKAAELDSLVKLKTSRRAASAAVQIARSVRDIAPDRSRIASWYSRRAIQRRSAQATLDLDIEAVPDPTELIDIRFWTHPPGKQECFRAVITDMLDRLERERRPRDLAILVARTRSNAVNLGTVRTVLDQIGVPYLDQTLAENKSVVLPEGHVRLVSYSSARGIEASRVLLLDLGYAFWDPANQEDGDVSRAMLYVALTRGRLGTTVLCAPIENERAYVNFLIASVDEYERRIDGDPDKP